MANEIIDAEFETLPSETQEPVQEPAPVEEQPAPVQEETPIEQAPVPEPIVFDVDPALLVGEFLKDKEVSDDDSLNLELFLKGDASGWRFKNIPAPSLEELKALEPQVSQKQSQAQINAEAQAFLSECDWKRQRHLSQKALGIATSLSDEEYLAMEQECQAARDRIVK